MSASAPWSSGRGGRRRGRATCRPATSGPRAGGAVRPLGKAARCRGHPRGVDQGLEPAQAAFGLPAPQARRPPLPRWLGRPATMSPRRWEQSTPAAAMNAGSPMRPPVRRATWPAAAPVPGGAGLCPTGQRRHQRRGDVAPEGVAPPMRGRRRQEAALASRRAW